MRSTAQGGPLPISYIQIGTQQWTLANLDTSTYINGESIPQVTNNTDWANLTTGAWCYYNNDSANGAIYGKLYNWYAISDVRGLIPPGWHVPTLSEWYNLFNYLGGNTLAGGPLKQVGTTYWTAPNTGATNSSGFTALPGGYRQQGSGQFYNLGLTSEIWTATENSTTSAWNITIGYNTTTVNYQAYQKTMGFSIRILRN